MDERGRTPGWVRYWDENRSVGIKGKGMIWGKKRNSGPFFRAGDLKRERKFHARFCGYCFLNEELLFIQREEEFLFSAGSFFATK